MYSVRSGGMYTNVRITLRRDERSCGCARLRSGCNRRPGGCWLSSEVRSGSGDEVDVDGVGSTTPLYTSGVYKGSVSSIGTSLVNAD
jgi:hypothetical protein